MDYETHYTYSNKHLVLLVIIGFFLINYYVHPMDLLIKKPAPTNTTNETNNTIIIYRNVTVTVTPTPDGKTYFAGEYEDGIRKLGRPFSWYQRDVQGKEDMSGHVKVYDYRSFDSIHVFDHTDYKYYEIRPADENNRYVFIFVKIYLDDVIGGNTPLWLPTEKHYYLQAFNQVFTPEEWDKTMRIKELEETWTDNNDLRIKYYGVFNTYSRDLRYAKTAGEVAEPIYYVMGGESNAIDGYIVYSVPKNIKIEDITVITDMYAWGTPSWRLIR